MMLGKDMGVGPSPRNKRTLCDPFIMIKICISIHYGQKLQSSVPNGKKVM